MKPSPLRKLTLWLSFLFFALAVPTVANAQNKDWRPVSPEELAAKTPSVEPDADAEAIFWEVRIDDSGDDLTMKHYVRVKIYTERGREKYSKFDVPFVRGLKIKDLEARVIAANGTITEIGKNDIFEREIVRASGIKVKAKSFAIPNIAPGVIVEYRYKEVVNNGGAQGMRLQFQRDIPVQTLSYYYKPFDKKEPEYQSYNFSDAKFVKDEKGFYVATRKNVPAFKEEPRMPPEDMVRAWMLLTGKRFTFTGYGFSFSFVVKDASDPTRYWASVSTQNAFYTRLMNTPGEAIKKTAAEITAGATTPDEKLKKIYAFCQTQIRNTTYDPTITDEERAKLPKIKTLDDILTTKSANSFFINMLFGALASASGMESRITLSGDRSETFFTPNITNEAMLHLASVGIAFGDQWKFFDPGIRFLQYGMLDWWEEDTWALLAGDKSYSWRKTPLSRYETSNEKRSAKFALLEDGTLEGDVRVELSGQIALTYRLSNYDETQAKREDDIKQDVKGRLSSAEVSEIEVENLLDSERPVVKKYKVRVPGYAQKTGKRLFLQPGFFESGSNPVFSSATRKYGIYFRYPWSETDDIEIKLPVGYELDNADAPGIVSDPKQIGSLKVGMAIDKANNILKYNREFHFGGGGMILFNTEMYTPLKNMFDAINKADTHTISLKQK